MFNNGIPDRPDNVRALYPMTPRTDYQVACARAAKDFPEPSDTLMRQLVRWYIKDMGANEADTDILDHWAFMPKGRLQEIVSDYPTHQWGDQLMQALVVSLRPRILADIRKWRSEDAY